MENFVWECEECADNMLAILAALVVMQRKDKLHLKNKYPLTKRSYWNTCVHCLTVAIKNCLCINATSFEICQNSIKTIKLFSSILDESLNGG